MPVAQFVGDCNKGTHRVTLITFSAAHTACNGYRVRGFSLWRRVPALQTEERDYGDDHAYYFR